MVTFCDCVLGGFLGQEQHPGGGDDKVDFRIDRRSESGRRACSEGAGGGPTAPSKRTQLC